MSIARREVQRLRHTLDRWRGVALLRALYWRHLRRWETEICHSCGRPVRVVWWDPEYARWREITGQPGHAGVRCVDCYDEEARERGYVIKFEVGEL